MNAPLRRTCPPPSRPQYHHGTSNARGNGVGTDVSAMDTGRPASSPPPSPAAPPIPAAPRVGRVSVAARASIVHHGILATPTTPSPPPALVSATCVRRRESQACGRRQHSTSATPLNAVFNANRNSGGIRREASGLRRAHHNEATRDPPRLLGELRAPLTPAENILWSKH